VPILQKLGKGGRFVVGKIEHHNSRDIRAQAYGMVSNPDIWRAANLLIREHGDDAELEAARMQDLMLDRDDDERRLLWARIRRALEALRAPASGRLN
jgi:hypothetical protein